MTNLDKLAREIADLVLDVKTIGGKKINKEAAAHMIKIALASYGDECAKQMREDAAFWLDCEADRQENAWKEHLASGVGGPATSYHSIPRCYANKLRALPLPSEKEKPND